MIESSLWGAFLLSEYSSGGHVFRMFPHVREEFVGGVEEDGVEYKGVGPIRYEEGKLT